MYITIVNVYNLYIKAINTLRIKLDQFIRHFTWQPRVLSIEDTINTIKKNKSSVARFGDGEMKLITGLPIQFQKFDCELSSALEQVLRTQSSARFIVCIPDTFDSTAKFEKQARKYWERFMEHNRNIWKQHLLKDGTYGNAFISRPYMIFKDKTKSGQHINSMMSLWEGRDILIVEGELSRLGVGNRLFSNTASTTRILCPNHNAWQYRKEILDACLSFPKDFMILLSLGPTATVLAYRLSEAGYQAIDIGHIDVELEWLNIGATSKIPIKGKIVNEAQTDEPIDACKDSQYTASIINKIGVK